MNKNHIVHTLELIRIKMRIHKHLKYGTLSELNFCLS